MKVNCNDRVMVRLSDEGHLIYYEHYHVFRRPDHDGWTEMTFLEFMMIFGPHMYRGCEPPFEMDIEIIPRR